jgi:hypothetical protein
MGAGEKPYLLQAAKPHRSPTSVSDTICAPSGSDRLTRCDSESVGGAIALGSANPRRSEPCSRRVRRGRASLEDPDPGFCKPRRRRDGCRVGSLCREVTRPSPRNRVRPSAEPTAAGISLPSHSATSSQQFPSQRDHHGFARTWLSRLRQSYRRADAMGGRQQAYGPRRRERPNGAPPLGTDDLSWSLVALDRK